MSVQPRLGGSLDDFIARYGQPNDHSTIATGSYHFERFTGSNTDGVIVQSGIAEGAAYANLAEFVLLEAPPDRPWSMSAAQAFCQSFEPPDTSDGHSQPITTAQGVVGVVVVAHNALLAASFPASAFLDATQRATPYTYGNYYGNYYGNGNYDVAYAVEHANDLNSGVVSCQLELGTTQTQG
jgi:hypothetical protein